MGVLLERSSRGHVHECCDRGAVSVSRRFGASGQRGALPRGVALALQLRVVGVGGARWPVVATSRKRNSVPKIRTVADRLFERASASLVSSGRSVVTHGAAV